MDDFLKDWQMVSAFLIGAAGIYRWWLKPTLDWRKDMEKWQVLVDSRLNSGDKRFDTLCTEIHELKSELQTVQQTLARIEGKMTNSVWQGVGNAS